MGILIILAGGPQSSLGAMLGAAVGRFDRRFELDGNALSIWCYSEDGLTSDESPRISLQDARGASPTMIRLLADHADLPPKKCVRVRIPFAKFVGKVGGTEDDGFRPRGLASVAFVQGLDDGRDHTMYVDDIRVVDDGAGDNAAPAAPVGLTMAAAMRAVPTRMAQGTCIVGPPKTRPIKPAASMKVIHPRSIVHPHR
jgi:hypothetical protein